MPQIHASAIVEGDVELADDVVIGPYCVIRGRVSIGAGTQLLGNVYLQGPLALSYALLSLLTVLAVAVAVVAFDRGTRG